MPTRTIVASYDGVRDIQISGLDLGSKVKLMFCDTMKKKDMAFEEAQFVACIQKGQNWWWKNRTTHQRNQLSHRTMRARGFESTSKGGGSKKGKKRKGAILKRVIDSQRKKVCRICNTSAKLP